jgi:hypothetical protein
MQYIIFLFYVHLSVCDIIGSWALHKSSRLLQAVGYYIMGHKTLRIHVHMFYFVISVLHAFIFIDAQISYDSLGQWISLHSDCHNFIEFEPSAFISPFELHCRQSTSDKFSGLFVTFTAMHFG